MMDVDVLTAIREIPLPPPIDDDDYLAEYRRLAIKAMHPAVAAVLADGKLAARTAQRKRWAAA